MRCCGCGADFGDATGPTHAYILSSPGCWEAYGRVLAKEYANPAYFEIHPLTVDAYAAQHPGIDGPQARNSVGIHLSRLCLILERRWSIERVHDAMPAITAKKGKYPWLTPPGGGGKLTVQHVLAAEDVSDHLRAVQTWSLSVWQAWAEHHAEVRQWVKKL